MYDDDYTLDPEEIPLARQALAYVKEHGLTLEQGWHINGEPPADVADFLNVEIKSCFPDDGADLTRLVIALIERELPFDEEEFMIVTPAHT